MLTKPSVTESVVGHPVVRAGVAVTAPFLTVLNPWAALLPMLADSLAGELQQRRANNSLQIIAQTIQEHKELLDRQSEAQFHLLTEVVSTTFTTINERKLEYLQSAVKNTLHMPDLASQEASLLGRIIRDLSAHEADFVLKNFGYDYAFVGSNASSSLNSFNVEENSDDSLVVRGLAGLGLLVAVDDGNQMGSFGQGTFFTFSKMAGKLIVLLRQS